MPNDDGQFSPGTERGGEKTRELTTRTTDHDDYVANPGAEDYRRVALIGLDRRDHRLAIEQIGAALAFDPMCPQSLAILERIAHEAPRRCLENDDAFFGAAAVRAWALARHGELEEALLELLAVARFRPDIPYLVWAREWLAAPCAARPRWEHVGPAFSALFERMRDADDLDACAATVHAAVAALEAFREVSDQRAAVTVLTTAFLRLLGRHEHAVRVVEAERARAPNFLLSFELGNLHRDAGDLVAAVPCFREAATLAPDEPRIQLALADALLDHADFGDAAETYARVARLVPLHARAPATALFARALAEPSSSARTQLERLAAEERPGGLAQRLAHELAELDTVLSSPMDPISRVVADALTRMHDGPAGRRVQIRIRSDHPAPPSARLALTLGARALGVTAELRLDGPHVGAAEDASWFPVGGCDATSWPSPDEQIVAALAALAATPFGDRAWAEGAAAAIRDWTPEQRTQLPRAMVQPVTPPPGWHALRWVYVTQVAAAYCIAATSATWEGSQRREWLFAIAGGLDDYTAAAAVIGLGCIARQEPGARPEIEALFAKLFDRRRASDGRSPSEYPLVVSWLSLPGLDTDLRHRLWQRRRRLRAVVAHVPPSDPEAQ
jgi:tetratricopeptide (TPR) repeat protein